jgi:hypothetical protein
MRRFILFRLALAVEDWLPAGEVNRHSISLHQVQKPVKITAHQFF